MATSKSNFVSSLEPFFTTNAPVQIPKNVRETLVKYIPWIDLILLVILSPAILIAFGLGTLALPFSVMGGADATAGLSLSIVALAVQIVLMVAALPGLFNRRISGWNLSLYSVGFNLVYSVLTWQWLSGLVGAVIGAYILFQIKSYYK